MIRKTFLELLYEAASIQRWNDHNRPHKGFTELDKQAHKMILAYIIGKFEETDRKANVNWLHLIEGGIFEFLHRIVLTDIKPPIYHQLMSKKQNELNSWVLSQLESKVNDIKGDFFNQFKKYLFEPNYCLLEKKILKAAHYLATSWEFKFIYNLNSGLYGLEETKTISYGIKSRQLDEGYQSLYGKYENQKIAEINFGQIFDYFRI